MAHPRIPGSSSKKSNDKIQPSSIPTPRPKKVTRSSASSTTTIRSLRNSSNRLWVQEQERRAFLDHLAEWSINHDSSPFFHGNISIAPRSPTNMEKIALGRSVSCILVDTSSEDAGKKIVIRLFPPHKAASRSERWMNDLRRDSMDLDDSDLAPSRSQGTLPVVLRGGVSTPRSYVAEEKASQYHLVIRSAAGWVPANEYFNKLYFANLKGKKTKPLPQNFEVFSLDKAKRVNHSSADKDSVVVRPLFRPFQRLPPELQDMIMTTAAGYDRNCNMCMDDYGHRGKKWVKRPSPISLATLFKISKAMNESLVPYVFRSTEFEFGLTGFTNFLWQLGPSHRLETRRLTFHFGRLALLHCLRWFAHDEIFTLFEPPVATNPRALQYFWRCQLQDLLREMHLHTLRINTDDIPPADLPMVAALLARAFGTVDRVLLVHSTPTASTARLDPADDRLAAFEAQRSWRDMCHAYSRNYAKRQGYSSADAARRTTADLDGVMDRAAWLFDQVPAVLPQVAARWGAMQSP